MTAAIPETHLELLERPIVVALATLLETWQSQVQPVWCSYDGRHVLVNTEKGRVKYRNMHERRQVTVLAVNPDDVYHWVEIRGTVDVETEEGADQHIDELAKAYLGLDKYPFHETGDVRVIFKITPQRVVTFGPMPTGE